MKFFDCEKNYVDLLRVFKRSGRFFGLFDIVMPDGAVGAVFLM